ncbi:hypothetical protein GCM10027037_08430 [Mucilaginibacter koreensis]
MMKRLYITAFIIALCQWAIAQDPHFSQYFASPLSLNPANTGFFDGNVRISANQRNQWWNVGYKYSTTSLSADAKILANSIPEDDVWAVGLSGLFEQSLNGALQSNYVSASTAYHKSLDYQGRQTLALGIQLTYSNLYLDFNRLTFASQFNGQGFDPSLPVNVNYANSSSSYIDLQAGLLYAAHLENVNLYAGASMYHIPRPKQSLFNPAGNSVAIRTAFHAGGEINISPQSSVLFSGLYMQQSTARDKLIGAAYGFKNNSTDNAAFKLYLGLWTRLEDALIPYIGADYQNFSLGLNYSKASNGNLNYQPETYEISLIYRLGAHNAEPRCPRF